MKAEERLSFLDLTEQYKNIQKEINKAIEGVLKKGKFILGEEVFRFEEEVADYLGVRYAVGLACGTDALKISLRGLDIGKGDEVITTPFTFIATAEAIIEVGAKPVFVDIEPETYNIDPAKIEEKITNRTKAIVPVHLYGQPAKMDAIIKIANRYKLHIIEDAAQAFGAEYNGRKVGSFGSAAIFSFFPSKILAAYGDAGMLVTNNKKLYQKAKKLRLHGATKRYYHTLYGYNSRLDELQAAILRRKLRYVNKWIDARRKIAEYYNKSFFDLKNEITIPFTHSNCRHVYNVYTIRLKSRNTLYDYLKKEGIPAAIYYPRPLHLQPVFRDLGYIRGDFPISERCSKEVLSLPIYPELTEDKQNLIIDKIASFIKKKYRE